MKIRFYARAQAIILLLGKKTIQLININQKEEKRQQKLLRRHKILVTNISYITLFYMAD